MEPGGGYFRVFYKTTKIVGAVEKVSIILIDSQKVTQAVHKMYSNWMFSKERIVGWEDKVDTDKKWANRKTKFKELYAN